MAGPHAIHVDLQSIPVHEEEGFRIRLDSAELRDLTPALATVNVEVNGKREGLRFDLAKQVFLDSLGDERLDAAISELRGPISTEIELARERRHRRELLAKRRAYRSGKGRSGDRGPIARPVHETRYKLLRTTRYGPVFRDVLKKD